MSEHFVKVRDLLSDKAEEFWNGINEIAGQEFESVVKPYLIKHGYSFSAGMGSWAIYNKKNIQLERIQIPENVLNVLELSVPLYDHELGSCMSDWEPDN